MSFMINAIFGQDYKCSYKNGKKSGAKFDDQSGALKLLTNFSHLNHK